MDARRTLTAHAPAVCNDAERAGPTRKMTGRQDWASQFTDVRNATLALAARLSPEDQQIQSMPDASPTKWHLAHAAWFFETFLLTPSLPDYRPLDARYAYLFNSYYEAMGDRHPRTERGLITRPTSEEVLAYRAHVDFGMMRLIETASEAAWPAIRDLIELGLHHEQQHQELILMDIKHAFSRNPLLPAYQYTAAHAPGANAAPPEWLRFEGGLRAIGHEGETFAFDNEGPRHKVWLECFDLADRLSTAGEYLAFMQDGGYSRSELWLSDGWTTAKREGWNAPLYWREAADSWRVFTLEGERAIDPSEPLCHLSFYEADAFARWSNARLPTEAEWEVVAASAVPHIARDAHQPADEVFLHPSFASSDRGLRQLSDTVWQWTASAYLPYPGFQTAEGAVGEYNGKFMSGQMVLRGGACITAPGHTRVTYRNFFPPEARWAFSGVRLARNV